MGAAALAVLLAAAASATAAAPPPAEAFGQVPRLATLALNPSGTTIAWSDDTGPLPVVILLDLGSRTQKKLLTLSDESKIRGMDWADDETLLLSVSLTK